MAIHLRDLSKELLLYCERNELEKVKACLTLEVDVNTVSEDGLWSGLTIAAHKNYSELVDLLLSHPDINFNQTTDSREVVVGLSEVQWTAQMFACCAGNYHNIKIGRLTDLNLLLMLRTGLDRTSLKLSVGDIHL